MPGEVANVTRLSVNVNKFALLRNSRDTDYPNLRTMAARAIQAGAHGITIHPRPDQRHIRYADVPVLSELVREQYAVCC
jgi:pyridoxine 5-phosphate synthase